MNLIDALKTGRPIRRLSHARQLGNRVVKGPNWLNSDSVLSYLTGIPTRQVDFSLDSSDLLADDWEVKPKEERRLSLSKKDLEMAGRYIHSESPSSEWWNKFLEHLGLNDPL